MVKVLPVVAMAVMSSKGSESSSESVTESWSKSWSSLRLEVVEEVEVEGICWIEIVVGLVKVDDLVVVLADALMEAFVTSASIRA